MTRLIAIGTRIGNDAIALRLIEEMAPELRHCHSDLEINYCEQPGQELLHRFDPETPTLLVDALAGEGADGSVIEIDPAELLENPRPLSTHEVSVAGALQLAQALGMLPRELAVFGIAADPRQPLEANKIERARGELRDALRKHAIFARAAVTTL